MNLSNSARMERVTVIRVRRTDNKKAGEQRWTDHAAPSSFALIRLYPFDHRYALRSPRMNVRLLRLAVRIRVGMLRRHPAIHPHTRASRPTQMLHPSRVRMMILPPRQLDQRLLLPGPLALKAVHPRQPPIPALPLLIPAHVALITLDMRHPFPSCRPTYHIRTQAAVRDPGRN